MKKITRAFICWAGLAVNGSYAAVDHHPTDVKADIKQAVTAFMRANDVPGVAVEIYVDGKPQSYYFGLADKVKKTPVTKNTIFEVGSITKVMTSLLLAQQVDSARMQLDNSVIDYIPDLPAQYEDITLVNLATHTAGLPFDVPDNISATAAMHDYLNKWSPTFSPDEQWVY